MVILSPLRAEVWIIGLVLFLVVSVLLTVIGKYVYKKIIELQRDKTNKMACGLSEDSHQPGHPPSLIRFFAVRMKTVWVFSYPLRVQRRLIRLGGCLA